MAKLAMLLSIAVFSKSIASVDLSVDLSATSLALFEQQQRLISLIRQQLLEPAEFSQHTQGNSRQIPNKPKVPQQFSTLCNVVTTARNQSAVAYGGSMWYDSVNRVMRLDQQSQYFPTFWSNASTYLYSDSAKMNINQVCRDSYQEGVYFADLFDWVNSPLTKFVDTRSVYGVECDNWNMYVNATMNVSLCANKNTPVEYTSLFHTTGLPGQNVSVTYTISYIFYNFTAAPPPPSVFTLPPECMSSPVCPSQGVQFMQLVAAQPAYNISRYDITNQDTADWLGDTFFTCLDVLGNNTASDLYTVISLFTVEVDTRWGQYALCNGYNPGQCWGSELYFVGREAAIGIKEYGGQCLNNSDVGNWFSMPVGGRCNNTDQRVGKDCSWRVFKRQRTVEIDCVFNQKGMLASCKSGHPPFSSSQQIFYNALTQTVDQGGCPDVPPPE